jgi:hypothetical protein
MTVRPAKRLLIAGHVNRVRANLLAEGHGDDNDPPLTAGISDEMVHTAIAIIGPYVKHATQPNSARTIIRHIVRHHLDHQRRHWGTLGADPASTLTDQSAPRPPQPRLIPM